MIGDGSRGRPRAIAPSRLRRRSAAAARPRGGCPPRARRDRARARATNFIARNF